jgi:hypothetical protein
MPKLTLDLDELQVSSFTTSADEGQELRATADSFGCTTILLTHTTSD